MSVSTFSGVHKFSIDWYQGEKWCDQGRGKAYSEGRFITQYDFYFLILRYESVCDRFYRGEINEFEENEGRTFYRRKTKESQSTTQGKRSSTREICQRLHGTCRILHVGFVLDSDHVFNCRSLYMPSSMNRKGAHEQDCDICRSVPTERPWTTYVRARIRNITIHWRTTLEVSLFSLVCDIPDNWLFHTV